MLGFQAENGEIYNKVVLVIVKRDHDNKAQKTVRYFVDIPSAKVICHDRLLRRANVALPSPSHPSEKAESGKVRSMEAVDLDSLLSRIIGAQLIKTAFNLPV